MSLAAAANAGRLTFEEFQAVSSRAKASDNQKKDTDSAPSGAGNDSKRPLATTASFGDFLEMPQVQGFVVAVMVLDTFSAFAQLLMRLDSCGAAPGSVATDSGQPGLRFSLVRLLQRLSASTAVLGGALSSFSGFALLFSTLEICAILVVFHVAVVGHFGYAIDCLVVSAQIWTEYTGDGLQSRLLNLLRFWRLARLVASLVAIEKDAHGQTRRLLSEAEGSSRLLQDGARRMEEELDKEKEARRAVDEMMASFKEEVDTLNEALKARHAVTHTSLLTPLTSLTSKHDSNPSSTSSPPPPDRSNGHRRGGRGRRRSPQR